MWISIGCVALVAFKILFMGKELMYGGEVIISVMEILAV